MSSEKPTNNQKVRKKQMFYLTQSEKAEMQGRNAVKATQQYLYQLLMYGIEKDMDNFLETKVKVRLGLTPEQRVKVNIEEGTLEVQEEEELAVNPQK